MSTIKESCNGPDPLAAARMRLGVAVNRSQAGLVFDTHQKLQYAAGVIRDDDRDLSNRIDEIEQGDVTSAEARKEMREIMQLIDARHEFEVDL